MINNERKNFQMNPANKFLVPIDKLNPGLFGVENLELKKIDGKKNQYTFADGGTETPIFFEPLKDELTISDFAVFCAVCSEYSAGNELFTIRRLWQKIGGGYHLPDKMKDFIFDSLDRLAFTKFTADLTQLNSKCHYSEDCKKIFKGYLLPLKSVEININGQISESVFQVIDTPPLLEIATLKKQIASYDFKLLDVPNLRTTATTLNIKFYLFYRVIAIIGSHKKHKKHFCGKGKDGKLKFKTAKKLPQTIVLNTLFEKCGLSDATKRQRQQARETISKVMNHFKEKCLIFDWKFEKENGEFHAIHFA